MTWTRGMKVLIYRYTGNDGELIKLGTIIFFGVSPQLGIPCTLIEKG